MRSPKKKIYKKVLIFSDLHYPAHHPDTVKFLKAVKRKYKGFDKVVCNGDLVDFHACAQWERNRLLPDFPFELEEAVEQLKELFKVFPKVDMTWGNHDLRVAKKAAKEGLSTRFLRGFLEAVEAPKGWTLHSEVILRTPLDMVKIVHDVGSRLIWKAVSIKGMNLVQGHRHTLFEIQYVANDLSLNWGMTTGCLIDHSHPAFNYARTSSGTDRMLKPLIGCGVIINGVPQLVPMVLDENGRWIGKLL